MSRTLDFRDVDGVLGYVKHLDGNFSGVYNGSRDPIHKLMLNADALTVQDADTKQEFSVNGIYYSGNAPDVKRNVVMTSDDRDATAREKFNYVLDKIDTLEPVEAFAVTND